MELPKKVEAIQAMQEFINQHLCESITLADLSKVCFYSTWHCHRLFTEALDITPADYIRKLRLSKSALKLRDENVKIIDVAFDLGFGSADGYQRAFSREFGINPKEYAKNPIPLPLFTPYEIKYTIPRKENFMEEKQKENIKNVFIQLIEKPERTVIIKRGISAKHYFDYCEEVGCDVWGILTSIKSISGEPVCLWLPKHLIPAGTSEYVQGVEVSADFNGPAPEGFEVIHLPACKYLMFQGEPFAEEDYSDAIEQLWAAVEKYDPSTNGLVWDRENPRIQLEPIGTRGYIELMAVK